MKICALTMVYRDYWAISQWYTHYARHLGPENLFIIAHGQDDKFAELCPKANVIVAPRDDLTGFDQRRGQMLNAIQSELGEIYEWVIRTDADELICVDPARFGSLAEMFGSTTAPAVFGLGLNLVELECDTISESAEPVLRTHANAVFSGHYSKAFAVCDETPLVRHGVKVSPPDAPKFPFELPCGVYLVHLKFANQTALAEGNRHRMKMASGPGKGLPGHAWRHADKVAKKFLSETATKPIRDWDSAVNDAYGQIGREPSAAFLGGGLIKAHSLTFPFRTILPDWFKTA
ncbi:MAG: glycosyltransferase family 2 protein [Paracoccaceae bacterium]